MTLAANILQLIGLALDLIGVCFMAYDIINIDKRFGTWDGIDNAREIAETTKGRTKRGLIFIGIGFLFQMAGTIINICHSMQ